MADQDLKVVITSDSSEAEKDLGGFGDSISRIGEIAAGIGLERLAEKFIEVGKASAAFAIENTANFEQIRLSFDVMLGSAKAGADMFKKLSDLAVVTPFQIDQVDMAAKQLLAMGAAGKEIVPDIKMLGDVASGLASDMEPADFQLQRLVHSFGQVRETGKLTGVELREMQMAGVPLIDTLVELANKGETSFAKLGTAASTHIEKGTKMSATALTDLNDKIKLTQEHIKILTDTHVKAGIATERHNLALDTANTHLTEYQAKLAGANKEVTTFAGSTKYTADQIRELIKSGDIKFEDVEKAYEAMTSKGGKFFDLMEKQSHTFKGTLTNLSDDSKRIAANIMGMDDSGNIKEGGMFDRLEKGARGFLSFLDSHKNDLISFGQNAAKALGGFADFVNTMMPSVKEAFAFLAFTLKEVFTPILFLLDQLWKKHHQTLIQIGQFIGGVLVIFIAGLIAILGGLIIVIIGLVAGISNLVEWFEVHLGPSIQKIMNWFGQLANALVSNEDGWKKFQNIIEVVWSGIEAYIKMSINNMISMINGLIGGVNAVSSKVHLPSIPSIPHLASGTSNFAGGIALVGEKGPELVNLPGGSSVTPADKTSKMMGNTTININNPTVRSDQDIKQIVSQVMQALGRQSELVRLGAL